MTLCLFLRRGILCWKIILRIYLVQPGKFSPHACEVGDDFVFMRLKVVFARKMFHRIIYLVQPGNFSPHVLDILTILFCCSLFLSVRSISTKVFDQFICFSSTSRSLGLIEGFRI